MNSIDPTQPSPSTSNLQYDTKQPPSHARLAYAILWAVVVLIGGGALVTYAAIKFDHLGLLALWPVGWAGGAVAAKILDGKSKPVGGLLGVVCFAISLTAMVGWIRVEIVQAEDSWVKAIGLLPTFFGEWPIFTIVALVMSISAAVSAWQQVAVRYVRVRIDD